jgi:hypothetical protein
MDFGCTSLGLGAGQCRWVIFSGYIYVHGGGAARRSDQCYEFWINTTAANGVHHGSHSALVAVVSHFLELKTELEVLRFGRSADLIEDKVDAMWIRVRAASNSLASHVPSSVARNPPDGVGE